MTSALFISAGTGDPPGPQAKKLAEAAGVQGVAVDNLFFPDGYSPPLPHEYQFNLDTEPGKQALGRMPAFLARMTG